MPDLTFENVSKSFGGDPVIDSFNATVHDGEFLVLLGPSGCGKSTLLRMIAGLSPVTSGELRFGSELANSWPPRQRGVAFVFQTYALYPHLTVRANIAFPLVMDAFKPWHHLPILNTFIQRRMMKSPEIAARTDAIARQLELEALLDRRPASLSGGQRQRVALARALIRNPTLYLLDEPLSNLDAKLRTQMRSEISALHHKVGKTFIYVTHDQVEAMTMATRIVVMDKGVVQQIDTPEGIYNEPANAFVARFVGSPPMNLIPVVNAAGTLTAGDGLSWSHAGPIPWPAGLLFGIRPEKLRFGAEGEGQLPARVVVVEKLGAETIVGCRLKTSHDAADDRMLEHDLVFVRLQGSPKIAFGSPCSLAYSADDVQWFDEKSGVRLIPETQH